MDALHSHLEIGGKSAGHGAGAQVKRVKPCQGNGELGGGGFTMWPPLEHIPQSWWQAWGSSTPLLATLFGQLLRGPFRKLPEGVVRASCRAEFTESLV